MKKRIRIFLFLFTVALLFTSLGLTNVLAGYNEIYTSYHWRSTIRAYQIVNADNTFSIVEAGSHDTVVETYSVNHELLSTKSIAFELPIFGAFYSGKDYNYIAYGQENSEENDSKEVIRIVRYDKKFNRIDSVSIKGGESFTINPFYAAAGRMVESGNLLMFHTSRLRYKTSDGLNHQSQLTILVDTSTMTVRNYLGRFQGNHVSHSFDQYAIYDSGAFVLLDHGDAYPRSVVMSKTKDATGNSYEGVDLFKIPGKIGDNFTGVTVGGFYATSEKYITVLTACDYAVNNTERNVVVCSIPKNSMNESDVRSVVIGKYVGTDLSPSDPHLVKISSENLMVLWQEFKDGDPVDLKYALLDKSGNVMSGIKTVKNYRLSESKPILMNKSIIWYTNSDEGRLFYSISFLSPIAKANVGSFTLKMRHSPSASSKEMLTLNNGAVAECLEKSGAWVRIRTKDGTEGWVASSYLCSSPYAMKVGDTAKVFPGSLKLRNEPSSTAELLKTLKYGDSLKILDNTSNKTWVKVDAGGTIGWVAASYIGKGI